jgi:glycosyltransferase involved in cell wall biosynthesis
LSPDPISSGPLVSIITATYNAARFLPETIDSVLAQTYRNLEYIVLDDGSTDETPEILRRYDGRVRWERHDNMGEARTVNKGFELSHGELVAVVSADDPVLPGFVEAMVEHLETAPQVVVAYPDWEMIDENGQFIQHITTFDYSYRDMVRWHHCIPGPGTFIRRSVIDTVGGRDPSFRYVGDYDFWLHAGLVGPFARVPMTLARYRHHPAAASVGQLGARMAKEHITMTDKLFARNDLPREILRARREAYSSAHWIAGVVAGEEKPDLRRYHFRRALVYAPHKYIGEYRKSRFLLLIAPTLFHGRLARVFKTWAYVKLYARVARDKTWPYAKLYVTVIHNKLQRLLRG